jgi:nucleoside-diphosphate-sugar epimerase
MATRSDLTTAERAVSERLPAHDAAGAPALATARNGHDPGPEQWSVLVTGAGGFVGGHIARTLAGAGHPVRGLTRRPPATEADDPSIEWVVGDLLDAEARRRALMGMRSVIHAAGWVSLGPDRRAISQDINVEATRQLLVEAKAAGVERFIYTSSVYTLAAGTEDEPADEFTAWNLECVDSPYTRTKRQAERLVLEASGGRFSTIALCPGMVQGARDTKPTSTKIVKAFSRATVAFAPPGGIPIVDADLLALAHRRALIAGGDGERYAVVGPYLSYPNLAALVASITGRPRLLVTLSDRLEPLFVTLTGCLGPLARCRWPDVSRPLAAGGFLRLHVRGDRANACFGLVHPPAVESIGKSL